MEPSVAIFISRLRIEWFKPRREDYRTYIYLYFLRCLPEIYGVVLTNGFAKTALLLFKVKTAFVYIRDQGNRLRKIYVDGFILRYFLVKLIGVFDRAIFYAGSTTGAFVLIYISGFPDQSYLEVPCFTFDTLDLSIAQDFYVGMPADLDQFR